MTGTSCDRFWRIDPLPTPPGVPVDSMAFHRWLSAAILAEQL